MTTLPQACRALVEKWREEATVIRTHTVVLDPVGTLAAARENMADELSRAIESADAAASPTAGWIIRLGDDKYLYSPFSWGGDVTKAMTFAGKEYAEEVIRRHGFNGWNMTAVPEPPQVQP